MIGQRNLAPERGPSVWKRSSWSGAGGRRKRWLTGLGGVAVAITGTALAAVGGAMVYRATAGRRAESSSAPPEPESLPLQARALEDVVSRASADSFPASDAPSWTPTTGARTKK